MNPTNLLMQTTPGPFGMPGDVQMGLGLSAMLVMGLIIFYGLIRSFLWICPPNEVLIFSGRRHKLADGTVRSFRPLFGGRGWRMPFFERVDRMKLNTMEIPIAIKGAYAQGGIPLNVEAIANVKISSDPKVIGNAIERFLGQPENAVRRVAKETLEGHLRGVLARLSPEQVNEDRLKFAEELTSESELDLQKLGLHLDTLKIQHVSDDTQYLNSIGREAIANVIRDAEIAESNAHREAELIVAENLAKGQVAESNADANIAKMKNELRRIQADLESEVSSEQERTAAAAREARAKAEQELQKIRGELENLRLHVEQVLPAEANQRAQVYIARGEAAAFRERGLAASQAMDSLHSAWRDAGPSAMNIMVMDDLDKILASAIDTVKKLDIGSVTLIDNGNGQALPNYISGYPAVFQSILESLKSTVGIDVRAILSGTSHVLEGTNGEVKK